MELLLGISSIIQLSINYNRNNNKMLCGAKNIVYIPVTKNPQSTLVSFDDKFAIQLNRCRSLQRASTGSTNRLIHHYSIMCLTSWIELNHYVYEFEERQLHFQWSWLSSPFAVGFKSNSPIYPHIQ